jgi:hypothetical protein
LCVLFWGGGEGVSMGVGAYVSRELAGRDSLVEGPRRQGEP